MLCSRLRLQHAALRMVAHGWPVMPGAPLRGDRFDCGRFGCHTQACHPARPGWQKITCRSRPAVHQWWRHTPHSVLLPTGFAFDVIEVPAPWGADALATRGRDAGPVAATPAGRWMFLVRAGEPLVPELASRLDLVRHYRGSWVPAPPTRLAEGAVRWVVSPDEVGWRLPAAGDLQERLVRCGCLRGRVSGAHLPTGSTVTYPGESGPSRDR